MKISKQIKKRITMLYCALLAFILMWIIYEGAKTFIGYGSPVQQTDGLFSQNIGPFTLGSAFKSPFEILVKANEDSSLVVKAKIRDIVANVAFKSGVNYRDKTYGAIYNLTNILRLLSLITMLTVVIVMITKVVRGSKTGDVFPRKNILFTRIIGFLILLYALLNTLNRAMDVLSVSYLFDDTAYDLSASLNITFDTLIIVILVFIFAEIFAIGNSISEENKMTI
jgi:hypothetical protein